MAVKRHRQNDPISPSSPNTKKRVFRRSTCLSFGALLASTADPQHWADPPCAPQRRPSVALNAFPLCRTGFWGKNTGSELGPETIQWGTSTLFDIMAELTRGWYRENMFHDGERSCKKKKTRYFGQCFIGNRTIFEGRCFEGLCSLSAPMRPCALWPAPAKARGTRDSGPIVALACEAPRTTCSKSRTRESVQEPGGRRGDAAVTGQFPCVRVLPLDRLPLTLQADVRDHVAKNK